MKGKVSYSRMRRHIWDRICSNSMQKLKKCVQLKSTRMLKFVFVLKVMNSKILSLIIQAPCHEEWMVEI
jgi:hypothetical protein